MPRRPGLIAFLPRHVGVASSASMWGGGARPGPRLRESGEHRLQRRAGRSQIACMRSAIEEIFRVLLAVVIPLASFTTGLEAPPRLKGQHLWQRPAVLGRALLAI